MTQTNDDLDAVRIIVDALKSFDKKEQKRIIRWALEKLGHEIITPLNTDLPTGQPPSSGQGLQSEQPKNIKDFIAAKNPQSENHLAATVAYFYKFIASEEKHKDTINKDDIQEACRLASIKRLKNPDQTLRNAHRAGLLDRDTKGIFSINAVGENLVAMVLPGKPTTIKSKKKDKHSKGYKRQDGDKIK